MTLGRYIKLLSSVKNKKAVCPVAMGKAHSWRASYDELAFEPDEYRTINDMLHDAIGVKNKVFHGYKGGEYRYNDSTDIHIDYQGHWTDGKEASNFIRNIDHDIDTHGRTEEWLIEKAIMLMIETAE